MKLKSIENCLAMIGITLKGVALYFGLLPITQVSIVFLFTIYLCKKIFIYKNIFLQRTIFFIFIYIFVISFILNYDLFDFDTIKMFIGFVVYMSAYYWYINSYQDSLQKIIRLYIVIAVMVAIIALIQQIGFLLDIRYLYDSTFYGFHVTSITSSGNLLRVYSIMVEPTHLGMFLLPSVFLSILKFYHYSSLNTVIKKWESVLIIVAYLLTLSLVTYLSLFVIFIFIFLQGNNSKIKIFFLVALSVTFFSLSIYLIPSIAEKYASIASSHEDKDFLTSSSGSSYFSMISNLQVSLSSLRESPFLGSGLNSHNLNYEKHIGKYYDAGDPIMKLNIEDAGSLYIRILSEFGIVGFLFFFYMIIKAKVKACLHVGASFYLIINAMSFISILVIAIRNGQYLNPMILFLFSLLIVTFRKEKNA